MAEDLVISKGDKEEMYRSVVPQILAITEGETDLVSNLANASAALREQFGWWWVGFYLVKGDELVLGPFQGPVACTRIRKGRGVCGKAWEEGRTLVVPDVEQFPGHIACSSASRSEIVVPVVREGKVIAVLDVDSEHFGHFDETDRIHLEGLVASLDFGSSFS